MTVFPKRTGISTSPLSSKAEFGIFGDSPAVWGIEATEIAQAAELNLLTDLYWQHSPVFTLPRGVTAV